jgi:hypothetical protein
MNPLSEKLQRGVMNVRAKTHGRSSELSVSKSFSNIMKEKRAQRRLGAFGKFLGMMLPAWQGCDSAGRSGC